MPKQNKTHVLGTSMLSIGCGWSACGTWFPIEELLPLELLGEIALESGEEIQPTCGHCLQYVARMKRREETQTDGLENRLD